MREGALIPKRPLPFDSWVAFDPAFACPSESGEACVLDRIPPEYRDVHQPALVNELDRRLAHLVRDPVQTRTLTPQCRLVSVMGSVVYAIGPDGRTVANAWSTDPSRQGGDIWLALRPCCDCDTPIVDLPARDDWLWPFKQGFIDALRLGSNGLIDYCDRGGPTNCYAHWVIERLRRRHWKPAIRRATRSRIAAAMALEPSVIEIAQRIRLKNFGGGRVSVEAHNHVIEHRADYLKLERENPQLMALYALLHRDLGRQGEPAERIKARVIAHGISPAMWRWIHHYGTAWLPALFHRQKHMPVQETLDYVHAVQRFGWTQRAPRDVVDAFIGRLGDAGIDSDTEHRRMGRVEPAMRAVVRWWENGSDKDRALLKTDLFDFMFWLAREGRKSLTPRQWEQLTLKGMFRRMYLTQERGLVESFGKTAWEPRFHLPAEVSGYAVVQLTSALQIWDEGQAMHHCVARHAAACVTGEMEIISLRHAQTGRRVATLGFKVEGPSVTTVEAASFANAKAPEPLLALAQSLAGEMTRQVRSRDHADERPVACGSPGCGPPIACTPDLSPEPVSKSSSPSSSWLTP